MAPRSPDLNPLDFYLWERLKYIVCAAPVDNEEALHHRSVDACQTMRNYPGIFELLRGSIMRRFEVYIESHGGHFEQLLYMYSFRYSSQIKCFWTHVDIVECRPVARKRSQKTPVVGQQILNKLGYVTRFWVIARKHVPAATDTKATIEERCLLCGPFRDVISRTI
jgi:hypothetical protein